MKYTAEEIKEEAEAQIKELTKLKLLPAVVEKLTKSNGIPDYTKDLNKKLKDIEWIYGAAEELARQWATPFNLRYSNERLDAKQYVKRGITASGFDTERFEADANRLVEKAAYNLEESARTAEEARIKEKIQEKIEKEREYTTKLIDTQNAQIEELTKKIGLLNALNDSINKRTDGLLGKFEKVSENAQEMVDLLEELKTQKQDFEKNTEEIKMCVETFSQGIIKLTELVGKIADKTEKKC